MVLMSGVTIVNRSIEDVWRFICDLKAIPSWASNVKRAKWTSPKKAGRGAGAKYNQTQHEGLSDVVYAGEVLESVQNVKRATVVRYQSYEVFVTFELAPEEAVATDGDQQGQKRTRVTMTVDVPSNTWLQYLTAPLASLLSKLTMPKQVEAFRAAADAYVARNDEKE